ncbi:integrase [Caulobacter segnis]|uniref:integrase n=1 Tax=Caulobacter segnis TaxID=88688 RepID=UPI0028582135|nr:integrase [Caulobacter segnis]MDR6624394.1 integrase [Caulobacter segnis]
MDEKRILLTDRVVAQLPLAASGRYKVRDTEVSGFMVIVGRRRKSYTAQAERWVHGVRESKSVVIGYAGEMNARDARVQAKLLIGKVTAGEAIIYPKKKAVEPEANAGITLRQAWERYLTSHMQRKNRSPSTIAGYADHVERLMADWVDQPLMELADDPEKVANYHDRLTELNGPSAANGVMRTLRAIYNHARKTQRYLPAENPTLGVDWNPETRRNTAMGLEDLPAWFAQARLMRHPVRREFHLFSLLSGSRPGALLEARLEHLNIRKRILHIPRPKGGADRAFDIPLSRAMILCLIRALRAGRMLMPDNKEGWIFMGESAEGRMVEHKENRKVLSKWGNDLRQTYRTLGQIAGLSEIDLHLLMNHSLPGVNAGYITRAKLISGHLQNVQEKLTETVLSNAALDNRRWPNIPSRLIGHSRRDPPPPDPRSNQAREARFWAIEAPKLLKRAQRPEPTATTPAPPVAQPAPQAAAIAAVWAPVLPSPPPSPPPSTQAEALARLSPRERMISKLQANRRTEQAPAQAQTAHVYQTSRY